MNKKVSILNYGLNNIKSLYSALLFINAYPKLINKPSEISFSDYLVLPGVGAYSRGIENLKNLGYYDEILNFKSKNRPVFGICLGMQMLFDESEEFGLHKGLGLINGKVKKLPDKPNTKLPNVGWYRLNQNENSNNNILINSEEKFYFNHGYYCDPSDKESVLTYSSYSDFCTY